MVYQDDKECLEGIQRVGCFFRSALRLAEMQTNKELTAEQINSIWHWAKKVGAIDNKNRLVHAQELATYGLRELGNNFGRFVEIATFKKGRFNWYKWVDNNLKKQPIYFIQKVKTDENTVGTHFRVVDKFGEVIFDPYSKGVNATEIVYSIVFTYLGEE